MIDREVSEVFPPYFLPVSEDREIGWTWNVAPADDLQAKMLIGEPGNLLAELHLGTDPNVSRLESNERGLFVRITAADRLALKDRAVLFALVASSAAQGETSEEFGTLIFSDWAVTPHEGVA